MNALTAYPWKIVLQNTIAVSLLSVIFGVSIIFWDRENQLNDQRRDIGHKFDALLSKIDTAVSIAKSLGSYVTIHGEITQSQLDLFFKSLELTENQEWVPMAIQVAPNGIVTFEAPWTGGPHIGHDLFSDPQRKTEAIAAARMLTSVIAGPLQLMQGGTALIVRHPILTDLNTDTPEVWGLAITLIDWVPIAQRISEIEKSSGTEIEVYVETLSGTRMGYPEVSADATLPFDSTSTPFGLGTFHYSFNPRYSPSGFAILIILVISGTFFLLVAVYRSRERAQDLRSHEADYKKSESLLAAGTSAYTVVDENFKHVIVSEAALKLCGFSGAEAPPYITTWNLTEDERQAQLQKIRALEIGEILRFSQVDEMQTPDGREIRIRRSSRWFTNPLGEGRLLWTSLDDVTELMNTQRQLQMLVDHDELTGLYSRRGLKERFSDGKRKKTAGVYIFDLDQFKSVNDSYGYKVGDMLLSAMGQTMTRLTETGGCAASLGGQEFAIVRPWQGWDEAKEFGEVLRLALEQTVVSDETRPISRTASIGIAMLDTSEALSEAMHLADHLAREAKVRGRNMVCAGEEEELRALELRGTFITAEEVQLALEAGEFYYTVQPIWNVGDRRIEGFEALIRWQKADGTVLSPLQFVNVFGEVTREPAFAALNTAMRKDVLAKLSDFPEAYVSFNYTLEQLGYVGASEALMGVYEVAKDSANRVIMIELSEKALSQRGDLDVLRAELKTLGENGFVIALDDFGVESSNINRLQELPIQVVKLDKTLIDDLTTSEKVRSIVCGIALTIKNLNMQVIVEGVETTQQAQILMDQNLYVHQGYLHAKPMRPEEVVGQLSKIGADLAIGESAEKFQDIL